MRACSPGSALQCALESDLTAAVQNVLKEQHLRFIKTSADGAMIGIANIIPGVSGGTVALMLGIYERVLNAIQQVSPYTVKAVFGLFTGRPEARKRFFTEMERIDAAFLCTLAFGAVVAVVLTAELITILLDQHHDPTYGFFFGLVLFSALTPLSLIKKKNLLSILMVVLGAAGVILVTNAISKDTLVKKAEIKTEQQINPTPSPNLEMVEDASETDGSPLQLAYIFVLGFVAISAMILPGVSGSFLLLLLGGYFTILQAITERDWVILAIFFMGCGVGLILFSRFINFLLKRWYDPTMGVLLGLVLGSLWMLWPFKVAQQIGSETVYLNNLFPSSWASNEWLTVAAAVLGSFLVLCLLWFEHRGTRKNMSS